MENKKDLGEVFRKKLNDLDKTPNPSLWDGINAELQKKKKRKIIFIPFWMKTAGVLSLVALISVFSIDTFLEKKQFSDSKKSNQDILNSKSFEKSNPKKKNTLNAKSLLLNDFSNDSISNKRNVLKLSNKKNWKNNKKKNTLNAKSLLLTDFSNDSISNKKNVLTSSNKENWKNNKKKLSPKNGLIHSTNNLIITDDSNKKTYENNPLSSVVNKSDKSEDPIKKTDSLILKKDKKSELKVTKEDSLSNKKSGLYVFVYGSPTYSGLLSNNSPLDNRLTNNPKSTEIKWSYGAYIGYESDYKWSLRLGIGKMNMSFITENAAVNTADYQNINYTENISNATIYTSTNFSETMTITQDISYTEIPLEIKYNFYTKKIGISSIVGFSYLFVDKNVISIKTANGSNFDIGTTKNLSENTFSINAGFEMYYEISKKLKLNIEPIFKYHLIDYKNNIKPYSFGVQTGLQFSFSD